MRTGVLRSRFQWTQGTPQNQYGSNTRDLILSLVVSENVLINKIRQFLCGLFDGRFVPCEGYIAKQIKRAAKDLQNFKEDLRNEMLKKDSLYWDDTVIFVNTKRACLRFYGDDRIAYYTAHEKKNLDGVREEGIMSELNESQKVMHDHHTGKYNREFRFRNVECNQHLERDAQRNTNDTDHTWSADLKDLIGKAIHDRNKSEERGKPIISAGENQAVQCLIGSMPSKGRQGTRRTVQKGQEYEGSGLWICV